MTLSTRRARLLACAALAAPALLLCGPVVLAGRQLAGTDFQPGYGPLYEFSRQSWEQTGELPRWNPTHFAGVPFLGNPQADLLYPPNWLYLLVPSGIAYGWLTFFHLLLAAGGMYRLTRGLGAGRGGAVLGGISYASSFALIGRIDAGHYPYLVTLCLAPLLLHLARLTIDRPRPLHLAGLASIIASAVMGGSPQFIVQLALLAGAFSGWRLIARARAGADWKKPAGVVVAAGLVGLLLSLAHVLPSLELAGASSRASGDPRTLTESFGDFPLSSLVGFFVPRFHWKAEADLWLWHEKALYTGLVPLVLAGAALGPGRRGPAAFFGVVALVALLAAAGDALPVHRVLSLLPTYSRYRVPERIVWVTVFSISVLASLGWEALARADEARRRRVLTIAGLVGGAVAASLLLGRRAPGETAVFVVCAAAAGAALLARGSVGLGLAVAVTFSDAGAQGVATLRYRPGDERVEAPWYEPWIGTAREHYRVLDLTNLKVGPSVHGFRLLRCGGYPVPANLSAFFAQAWESPQIELDTLPIGGRLKDLSILRQLNVRWIVTEGSSPHPELKLLARQKDRSLYEDPGALPAGVLEGAEGTVSLARPAPHRMTVDIDAGRAARLVLSEAWFPGWSASSGGAPVALRPFRNTLMEADVPAGRSRIEFSYAPPSWRTGCGLSALGAAVLLACLALEAAGVRARRGINPGP